MCSRRNAVRQITMSVSTIANPEKIAPATNRAERSSCAIRGGGRPRNPSRRSNEREDQRRREGCEDEIGALVVVPLRTEPRIRGRRGRRQTSGGWTSPDSYRRKVRD